MICFFCLSKCHWEHKSRLICDSCLEYFHSQIFLGCNRCGRSSCTGCEALNPFRNIFCLFAFQKPFSDIVNLSKNKNNILMQKLFEELLYRPAYNALAKCIEEERYSLALMAPLRKSRLLFSRWHTCKLFQKIFLDLKQRREHMMPFLMPHYQKPTQKQSHLPIWARKEQRLHTTQREELFTTEKWPHEDFVQKILILDDILTTGNTICQLKQIYPSAMWDVFTFFRTPQK